MFEGFDEADLLALVEDELDPKREARLRRRLADHPEALAVIERLRGDRDVLRTSPEPDLPTDLLTELEPMMARPMLMPEPTDWRRRYRRRRPRGRYAAAAAIGLALLHCRVNGTKTWTEYGRRFDGRIVLDSDYVWWMGVGGG